MGPKRASLPLRSLKLTSALLSCAYKYLDLPSTPQRLHPTIVSHSRTPIFGITSTMSYSPTNQTPHVGRHEDVTS